MDCSTLGKIQLVLLDQLFELVLHNMRQWHLIANLILCH